MFLNHEGHEAHEGSYAFLRVLCVLRGELFLLRENQS